MVEKVFARHHVKLTLGGEPTYVPIDPDGNEWRVTALGPTKLRYGRALADALIAQSLPHAIAILSPGKTYPGEMNPRWSINLLWRRDGGAIAGAAHGAHDSQPDIAVIEPFKKALSRRLRLGAKWLRAIDPLAAERVAWVLPLDHDGARFTSDDWALGEAIELLRAEGAAGLRLPLASLPPQASRRALTIEIENGRLHVFLPPLLQPAFIELLEHLAAAAAKARMEPPLLAGYVPHDAEDCWSQLAITADPGVLEINLPPCASWADYGEWLARLERATTATGLRSFKQVAATEQAGTGGGNHLLFGGPSLDQNPLFTHPRWVTSILRYWQHHPSLAYLFTGHYVGSSSQAPRPDESARALSDLEMAYAFLEQLPRGDHRQLIGETLRHLHTDTSGNTHRSEVSFDKFWNASFAGGCRGLVEFRAVESLPSAEWMSAVALLWRALAARLLAAPFTKPLVDHGTRLHDRFFLPAWLWADFESVLRDVRQTIGVALPREMFRAIADWRFPAMLSFSGEGASLTVRKALESWPLLCEEPLEGGSTSRFVDTSIERIEFLANREFADHAEIRVQGRRLCLQPFPQRLFGAGLRYRRSALYPSLHPGIAPHMPLWVAIKYKRTVVRYRLDADRREFTPCDGPGECPPLSRRLCRTPHPESVTCDLRIL